MSLAGQRPRRERRVGRPTGGFGLNVRNSPGLNTYRETIWADSPIAYWHLNETGSGPFIDVAGGHSATPNGTIVSATGLVPTELPDAAARFNPGGTLFQATTTWTFPGTQPVSVEFWAKPYSLAADSYYWVDSGATDGFHVSTVASSGAWRWVSTNVLAFQFNAVAVVGKVQHVVFTMVATGEVALYIDGVLTQTTGVIGMFAPTVTGYIGHGTGSAPNADVDEFAIYKVALTPEQVAAHYAAGVGEILSRRNITVVRRTWAGR